jgi:uncharacterized protein
MANRPSVLIAAASGRALAASAHRGGYLPLVADQYGDLDTLTYAHRFAPLPDIGQSGDATPLTRHKLLAALDDLARDQEPFGLVYGSGFEAQPELLGAIAARFRLLGNDAESVRRLKDPLSFGELCAAALVRHPETVADPPPLCGEWLIKRRGGSGGAHVRPRAGCRAPDPQLYFQRRAIGAPISVTFLAADDRFEIVGFSQQWQAPSPQHPYRYGGAAKPADLSRSQELVLEDVISRLLRLLPLRGLNGADFLVTENDYTLLEINPRPGATLDIFEPESNLFHRHVAACLGTLGRQSAPIGRPCARAAAVVYATRDIHAPPVGTWPDWTADRQQFGTRVAAGAPLCTVVATADSARAARRQVDERGMEILRWAQGDTA